MVVYGTILPLLFGGIFGPVAGGLILGAGLSNDVAFWISAQSRWWARS